MTTTPKVLRPIVPQLGFSKLPDADFLSRLTAIVNGLTGNAAYPNPPMTIADFKTAVLSYSAAIAAALDGGKSATAARRQERENVNAMVRVLGQYVENTNKGDMTLFLSSGFTPLTHAKAPAGPLPTPGIDSVDHGNSGQLLVSVTVVKDVRMYEVQAAPLNNSGAPGQPVTVYSAIAKSAIAVNGLTPGTNYAVQVRAFGKSGPTDWSPTVNCICA